MFQAIHGRKLCDILADWGPCLEDKQPRIWLRRRWVPEGKAVSYGGHPFLSFSRLLRYLVLALDIRTHRALAL
jgi:hypothetical protein